MILSKLVRDCHRPFCENLHDKLSNSLLYPQTTHARRPHSSLDEEMEDRQGAESLHASFNQTEKAYKNMKDRADRLRVVLQNHHFKILPFTQSLEPRLLKKRKAKAGKEAF